MKIKKLMALPLAAIVGLGAAAAYAATAQAAVSDFVQVSGTSLASPMVVIGNPASPSSTFALDVLAAADLSAHVAGYATTDVVATGSSKSFSVSGEGQEIATANTKIYLDDSLGKSGVRTTMTDADLPTLLMSDSVVDKNSTTIKYDQFLFLTPSDSSCSGSGETFCLEFERPSSSSADDGMYSFGRFTTSPTNATYMANYRLNFKKDADFSALVGKTLTIAGETYTVLATSSSVAATPTLVTTKASASQSVLVSDGPVSVTVGSSTYQVQVIGTSDSSTAVVSVDGVSKSATKGATTNINAVDVYVDDVFHFANNQDSSGASLLIGAEKTTFTHNSKIKVGSDSTNVDGTYVRVTTSGGKASTLDIYFGADASSVTDNLRQGGTYTLPGLTQLALFFPGVSEDSTASSRNMLSIDPSGDNLIQSTWTDDRGSTNTVVWAYKATSAGTTFSLADSNAKLIHTQELKPVSQDEYVILDAGDFPHMMQLTSIDSSALSFTLLDVFAGSSVKHDLAVSDNGQKTVYIDGQAYYAQFNTANNSVSFSWGDSAAANSTGDATTVWPTLKGYKGERVAFLNSTGATVNATSGKEVQLPTGAVTITTQVVGGTTVMNLTAATDEDGETSACTATPCVNSYDISGGASTSFTLGKTATGGFVYNVTVGTGNESFVIKAQGTATEVNVISQPALLLVEEKDDAGNRYSTLFPVTTEASGSNNVAIPAAPIFTASEDSQTRGSDSTITDYVDLYGLFVTRTTSGQDTLKVYYPDEQVYAVIGAGASSATASVGGSSGSTVKAAVVLTSPVAKLDSEVVGDASLSSDLVLVGGPCANTLVASLAAESGSVIPTCSDWTLTTGLIKEVQNVWGSGQKALVVAGTNAADTRSLAAQVMTGTTDFLV